MVTSNSNIICVFILCLSTITIGAPPNRPIDKDDDVQIAAPNKMIKKQPDLMKRPDHLEAVPLERDGQLNKDFRQELLLGRDTNNIQIVDDERDGGGVIGHHDDTEGRETADLLKEMFSKADKNADGKLNGDELESKIIENTLHHLDEGQTEANTLFNVVDQDGDHLISWDEYHYHFLIDHKLMEPERAKNFKKSDREKLDEDTRFRIEDEESAFHKADADQNGLDEIEWLSFRHPEHSQVMLKDMADEILRAFDKNNDNRLSEDEFAASVPGVVDDAMMAAENEYLEARRHEFRQSIDTDHNGFASADELLEYVNPRNPLHAKQEVTEIMSIADENQDGFLTIEELLARADLLERSGFIRPNARLHDDL